MNELIDRLIDLAFAEDIGDGDHTTLSCIPATAMGKSKLLIKEAGVLAGIEIAKEIFHRFDPTMKVEVFINDGAEVKPGDVAMIVEGKIQSLLQTERLMLNVMQRMSGIATMTRKYVKQLEGTKTRVLDTRKTTPGLRMLEKAAVKIGGGVNHRIGLFDMILLKDNHVDFAGGIDKAINRAKEYCKEKGIQLEAHTPTARNDKELRESDTMKKLGTKYNKSSVQITIRWHYQNGVIPVVSTFSGEHMKENLDIFDFELTEADMKEIDALDKGKVLLDSQGIDDPNYIYNY